MLLQIEATEAKKGEEASNGGEKIRESELKGCVSRLGAKRLLLEMDGSATV